MLLYSLHDPLIQCQHSHLKILGSYHSNRMENTITFHKNFDSDPSADSSKAEVFSWNHPETGDFGFVDDEYDLRVFSSPTTTPTIAVLMNGQYIWDQAKHLRQSGAKWVWRTRGDKLKWAVRNNSILLTLDAEMSLWKSHVEAKSIINTW